MCHRVSEAAILYTLVELTVAGYTLVPHLCLKWGTWGTFLLCASFWGTYFFQPMRGNYFILWLSETALKILQDGSHFGSSFELLELLCWKAAHFELPIFLLNNNSNIPLFLFMCQRMSESVGVQSWKYCRMGPPFVPQMYLNWGTWGTYRLCTSFWGTYFSQPMKIQYYKWLRWVSKSYILY